MVQVLFVCLGNICRSPTADGIFRHLIDARGLREQFSCDSAGTSAFHEGEPADRRSQREAARHGVDLSFCSSRKVSDADFHEFDYIVAMDEMNMSDLLDRCPPECRHKLSLMLDHGPPVGIRTVPDPYYNPDGFALVFRLLQDACAGLLDTLTEEHYPEYAGRTR